LAGRNAALDCLAEFLILAREIDMGVMVLQPRLDQFKIVTDYGVAYVPVADVRNKDVEAIKKRCQKLLK
jgi:hypothetical protein